ncbi:hypothetical protein [Dactylosporangium salmoneum]|uniref:MFS transporter n=1 Tax=Dactylosporangium salmoneum TaxID=53361 RepID=A0ABP5SZD1_9ACTN
MRLSVPVALLVAAGAGLVALVAAPPASAVLGVEDPLWTETQRRLPGGFLTLGSAVVQVAMMTPVRSAM